MKTIRIIILLLFLSQIALYSSNIINSIYFNPNLEIEYFNQKGEQFLISNSLIHLKSQSHFSEFRLIDVGLGGRYSPNYYSQTIGKVVFMTGNFWSQKPLSDSKNSFLNKMQIKTGFTLGNLNTSGILSTDCDAFSVNTDICYNPNSVNGKYNQNNVYAKQGLIFKITPQIGYTGIFLTPNMLTGKDSTVIDTLHNIDVRLNILALYNFGSNYTLSASAGWRNIALGNSFYDQKYSIRFTKEFFYGFNDEKSHKSYVKDLELFCSLNYYSMDFRKNHFSYASFTIGLNFFRYKEYINAYQYIQTLN